MAGIDREAGVVDAAKLVSLKPALAAFALPGTLLCAACAACAAPEAAKSDAHIGRIASYCHDTPRQVVVDRVRAHFERCYGKAPTARSAYLYEPGPNGARFVFRIEVRDVLTAEVKSGTQSCFAALEVRAVDADWASRFEAVDAAARGQEGSC